MLHGAYLEVISKFRWHVMKGWLYRVFDFSTTDMRDLSLYPGEPKRRGATTWRNVVQVVCLALSLVLAGCSIAPTSSSGKGYPARVLGTMQYSPDGKLLAVGYSGSSQGELEIWDMTNPNQPPVVLPAHGEEVESLAFSDNFPDCQLLAYGASGGDGIVRVVPTCNLKTIPIELPGHADDVRSVVLTSDGKMLVSLDLDNLLRVWDLTSVISPAVPTQTIQMGGLTNVLAISPDGQTLAIGGFLSTDIELRQLSNLSNPGEILHGVLNAESPPVFSPDGRYLAIGASTANVTGTPIPALSSNAGSTAAVQLWDLTSPDAGPWLLLGNAASGVGGVAFSSDGKWLANTKIDTGLVEMWDMSNFNSEASPQNGVGVWKASPASVFSHEAAYSVAFNPGRQELASGSMYTSINLWAFLQPSAIPTVLADPVPTEP
jgi:WD40 repeat protein